MAAPKRHPSVCPVFSRAFRASTIVLGTTAGRPSASLSFPFHARYHRPHLRAANRKLRPQRLSLERRPPSPAPQGRPGAFRIAETQGGAFNGKPQAAHSLPTTFSRTFSMPVAQRRQPARKTLQNQKPLSREPHVRQQNFRYGSPARYPLYSSIGVNPNTQAFRLTPLPTAPITSCITLLVALFSDTLWLHLPFTP